MSKRAIGVLIACFGTIFIAYAVRYSYGVLLPEMMPALSITKAQAGIIFSSYFVAYTVLSPVLGTMADRYDVRAVLALFVGIMGAGTLLMAFPSSLLQAILFFTLAGIGCSACWAPTMALAQRWTSDKRRGMTLAFIDAGSSLGIIAGGAAVPLIVNVFSDWRAGWASLGGLGLFVAVLNLLLVREPPSAQAGQRRSKFTGLPLRKLFSDVRFWLIGLAYLLTGFSIIIPFTFLSTYAVQELSFPYDSATRLITVIGVSAIVAKMVMGPISDRIKCGRIKIMMLCALLIAGGALGMAYSRGWVLWLTIAIFGAGYGGVWSMYAACASDYFSKESAGGIIGLWTFYLGIGSISAPILAGWTADSTGTLVWSFLIASAGAVVSFILLIPMLRSKVENK